MVNDVALHCRNLLSDKCGLTINCSFFHMFAIMCKNGILTDVDLNLNPGNKWLSG